MSSSATQKGWYYIYLLVLYSLPLSVVGNTTTYYINKVKDYSSLAQCAVSPLSVVVRDMKSGCGDGGQIPKIAFVPPARPSLPTSSPVRLNRNAGYS